ncbi:inositol 1,4,5-trisphosphate receptor-interacting protein-like 1 [Aquila chrysaetos chrysaetos]|uniref:inositol 1,4,5-trisphosphate receptor-interacting protein-like 1 n=1 Tax=Aquila chrysaetos chrysaetos TaxID=223781 RepID=UPI001176C014|nr:inositol 1,4,5-trisphosphate receptor-interacting protein-like 1 [Aquila chrysaetos chrysaetos]
MAVIQFFTLLVQSILWNAQMVGDELDEATRERMQQREEYLSWEMTRLLQELEQGTQELAQRTQEQSGFAWGALLFAALWQWQFWAVAGVLLLLFALCCRLRKRSHQPASSSKEASCRKKADKEEQKVKSSVAVDVGRISVKRLLDLPESFMMVDEMVDELLRICRKLSRNSFMPRLKPAVGVRSALEGWSLCEDDAVYHLLVPLKPPRGHAFHLQLGTTGEMPARNSRLRVELECTCMRERLVEDVLCFLHHPEEELRKNQGPSLLRTLCTGPYLDMEKTTRWFQILVKAAWVVLPQSRHYRLTVLPSRRSCKLRLTNASDSPLLIEMIFGVQQDGLDTFLSIE